MNISTKYLDKLLDSSINFYNYNKKPTKIPNKIETLSKAKSIFLNSLRFEASEELSTKKINIPKNIILNAVDLDKDNPGIISDIHDFGCYVHRKSDMNTQKNEMKQIKNFEKSILKTIESIENKNINKSHTISKNKDKKALNEIVKNEKKYVKEKEKKLYDTLSKDDKKVFKEKKKEERKKQKIKKEKEKEERKKVKLEKERKKKRKEEKEEENTNQNEEINNFNIDSFDPYKAFESDDNTITDFEDNNIEKIRLELTRNEDIQNEKIVDEDIVKLEDLSFYGNPVTYNRYIEAFNEVNPNNELSSVLLHGKNPSNPENVQIFLGPPGTGKTYTTVSVLKKMLEDKSKQHERFFICAQSNVGTINLYNRAKSLGIKGSLILAKNKIPKNTFFSYKEKKKWNTKDKVVFSTVSNRFSYKLKYENFENIFLDEAGQIPEAYVWTLLRNEVKRIVMAGDFHQLEAIVSEKGEEFLHQRSMMERLIDIGVPHILLNIQRRMNPQIISFPNQKYYDNALKTNYQSDNKNIEPYLLVNVNGKEENIDNSYYNIDECLKIKEIIETLKEKYNDIVIISPYNAQCIYLNKRLNYPVHTIDSFQGNEADVIIMCTVRVGDNMGFWNNYKRLNVALTRAKHVLRVVGHFDSWKKQKNLKHLLKDGEERGVLVL